MHQQNEDCNKIIDEFNINLNENSLMTNGPPLFNSTEKSGEFNIENLSPISRLNLKREPRIITSNSTNFDISAPPFIQLNQNFMPQNHPYQFQNYRIDNFSSQHPHINDIDNCRIQHQPSSYLNSGDYYFNNPSDYQKRPIVPFVLQNGVISIILRYDIRIDMTLNKSIRVFNKDIIIALTNQNGGSVSLIHPNGRIYQIGSKVEIMAQDGMRNNNFIRFAKMWFKGISFTSENCALIYLVDSAGTRTTTDSFGDIGTDITTSVFYQNAQCGPEYFDAAMSVLQNSSFWINEDGTENFNINGFRISQALDGMVRITKTSNKFIIRTSPCNGSATITTPYIHCTASLGQTSHLFVRRGERRMHFDGASFVVRNAGHSAGFDEKNFLRVY